MLFYILYCMVLSIAYCTVDCMILCIVLHCIAFYNTTNVKNMHLHRDSNPGMYSTAFHFFAM